MNKMIGKSKHWGRWHIDTREPNRSARARENRDWRSQEADQALIGLTDWQEPSDTTRDAQGPHQAPAGGAS